MAAQISGASNVQSPWQRQYPAEKTGRRGLGCRYFCTGGSGTDQSAAETVSCAGLAVTCTSTGGDPGGLPGGRRSKLYRLSAPERRGYCLMYEDRKGFLRTSTGVDASTPISALAEIEDGDVYFRGQLLSLDGRQSVSIEKILPEDIATSSGKAAAEEL